MEAMLAARNNEQPRTWFRSEPGIGWIDAAHDVLEPARALTSPWLERIERADYAGSR